MWSRPVSGIEGNANGFQGEPTNVAHLPKLLLAQRICERATMLSAGRAGTALESDEVDMKGLHCENVPEDHGVGWIDTGAASFNESRIRTELSKAYRLITSETNAELKQLDITGQQLAILQSLRDGALATPSGLSRLLEVNSGLITRLLDKLEQKRMLKRSRTAGDRRVVEVMLTKKGEEIAAQAPVFATRSFDTRFGKFTRAEFEEFGRLLRKFVDG